jgi:hypothetical protein
MVKLEGNRRGRESDKTLLEAIKEYPGLSQYELARKLRWQSGRIDSAVRRLLKSNKAFLMSIERNGRRVNLVYPEEQRLSNLIEVPNNLLEVSNPRWTKQAFFYALDNSTIGISGSEIEEWKAISQFYDQIPLQKSGDRIILRIPETFWKFYHLDKKFRVVSINGNNLLVTVAGDIVEKKKYPS